MPYETTHFETWPVRRRDDMYTPCEAVADQPIRSEERCPKCGGLNGSHGLVHTRHGNGGGSNGPCPNQPVGGAS